MATKDIRAARRAYLTNHIVGLTIVIALWVVGFALLGFFQVYPERLPDGIDLTQNGDKGFPYYIAFMLPPGISGLVVVAMFAAAMSSIDSGVNSITAVVSRDFLERFGRLPEDERKRTLMAKIMAFGIGAVIVVGSSFLDSVPGNIWAVSNKTSSLFTAPIFGLFFFAFFVPFARPLGVGVGAILENGGTIENAQAIAAHESPRTTKLYDRTGDEITLDEVERIAICPRMPAPVVDSLGILSGRWTGLGWYLLHSELLQSVGMRR